jgi:hypothetical protein
MLRSRRSFAWSLVLALLCASIALAQKPPSVARAAGALFTVTTTSDQFNDPNDGCTATTDPNNPPGCTLREALNSANLAANAGSTVDFLIPPSDPGYAKYPNAAWIITPTIALPPIANSGTVIDGATQTNRVGNTNNDGAEIIINGLNITNAGGIVIPPSSNGNTVRGIGIVNFKGDNTPGSLKGVGIEIYGSGNFIEGNYIGLGIGPSGTIAVPNVDAGIIIYGQNNTIGGDATSVTTKFNVISGNTGDGILLNGGSNNIIAGNFIGTNGNITSAIPNGGNGINMRNGASGNTIGNYQAASVVSYRNFIGGNNGYGILIKDSSNNKIYGNFVGLDRFGSGKISNGLGGIRIDGTSTNSATGNIIGATTPSPLYMRNYVAGSAGPGIQLNSFGARQNQVVANYVGLGSNNQVPGSAPQLSTGILLDNGASNNTVGGSIAAGAHNIVGGINGDGIKVAGFFQAMPLNILRAQSNTISGNYVGVGPNGTAPVPNSGAGIALDTYVINAAVGGGTADLRNLISNNALDGIAIRGTNVATTTIQKNTISFNGGNGINISNAFNTTVDGGNTAGANTIASNGANGISVANSITTTIQFNAITNNIQNGVLVTGALSRNTFVKTSTLNINTQNGVLVDNQAFNTQITGSQIYSNTLKGVLVSGTGTQRVKILDNSMQGNLAGGIDLTPDTTTPPAGPPTGSASNPNHDIDPPYSLHIDQTGKVSGKVRLTPNSPAVSACAQPCTIQIFSSNSQTLDGQGRDKFNVTVSLTPDSLDPSVGNFSASVSSVPAQLALTATDKDGNTSEFAVLTRQFGLDIQPPRSSTAFPGQVVVYTHRITNTGTVDFTNIQFSASSKLGWTTKLEPSSPITLLQGQSKPVTLTLTLPTGSAPNVRAGLVEQTRLTVSATTINPSVVTSASITDTTTVLGKFILDATFKNGRAGTGTPGTLIDYSRTITNTGNLTGTVTLAASTDLGWTTSITPTTVQLPPGKSVGVVSRVTIPQGATANTVAKTTLTLNGTPDAQRLVITDTTTVLLTPKATMVANDEKDGAAGETVQFCHTVTNLSNGLSTFTLTGVSSLGSAITFVSDTPGITLVNGKTFTLGNTPATDKLNFCAKVVVYPFAGQGQTDLIAIGLTDEQGAVVGGASVRDLIHVVRGKMLPRLYLPVARR